MLSPYVTGVIVDPAAEIEDADTAWVLTPVTKPLAFTVITGIKVAEPKEPTLELTVAKVAAADTALDPLKLVDHETSPVILIDLEVASALALVALPDRFAVTVPAEKFPEASLATTVPAIFDTEASTAHVAAALPL